MDLSSLHSARVAAAEFLEKSKTLNILINNAGIMALLELTSTADGFEAQFEANNLTYSFLFRLLKPTLLGSSTTHFNSRVVNVSSSLYRVVGIQFDDYGLGKGGHTPWAGYGQSKTANIWMANEIGRRYRAQGLHGLSLTRGEISTGLQVHIPDEVKEQISKSEEVAKYMKSPEQGASITVFAALSKDWEGRGERYWKIAMWLKRQRVILESHLAIRHMRTMK